MRLRARSVAIFSGERKSFSQPARSDDNCVSQIVFCSVFLHPGRAREMVHAQSSKRRVCGYFLGNERQRHSDSAETLPLAPWHSGFDAELPRRLVYGKNFRQRRRAEKYSDGLFRAAAAHAHHCLHGKIRNEKGMRTALELPLAGWRRNGELRNYLFMVCVCQRAQSDGCDWLREPSLLPARKNLGKIEAPDAASRAARLQLFFPASQRRTRERATFRAGFFA